MRQCKSGNNRNVIWNLYIIIVIITHTHTCTIHCFQLTYAVTWDSKQSLVVMAGQCVSERSGVCQLPLVRRREALCKADRCFYTHPPTPQPFHFHLYCVRRLRLPPKRSRRFNYDSNRIGNEIKYRLSFNTWVYLCVCLRGGVLIVYCVCTVEKVNQFSFLNSNEQVQTHLHPVVAMYTRIFIINFFTW